MFKSATIIPGVWVYIGMVVRLKLGFVDHLTHEACCRLVDLGQPMVDKLQHVFLVGRNYAVETNDVAIVRRDDSRAARQMLDEGTDFAYGFDFGGRSPASFGDVFGKQPGVSWRKRYDQYGLGSRFTENLSRC